MQNGSTQEQVLAGILASAEFAGRANALIGAANGDTSYVQALYQLLLNRTGIASDVAYWQGQLVTQGRSGVAQSVLASAEFRRNAIRALYGESVLDFVPNLLRRSTAPAAWEQQFWTNSSLDLLSIEGFLTRSDEYRRRGP